MDDFPFQLVIVIVFLVIGAIRWVIENILGKKQPPTQEHWEEYDYEERAPYAQPAEEKSNSLEDLYEEARREIQERQNRRIPQPEVIQEKLSEYRTPTQGQAPPPIPGKARINRSAPVKAAPPVESKKVQRRPVTAQQAKAAAAFEMHTDKEKRAASVAASGSRVRKLLATPSASRDAIILAEVLGKPKGIR